MPYLVRIVSIVLIVCIVLGNSISAFAQSVGVNAQVPPSASDLQIDINSLSGNGPFAQGTEILYEITYSQTTSSPQEYTIQANWSLGHFQSGVNSPSVEVLEYVIGSASDGYNNTPPVIDPTNRTITWTIASLPPNTTGETVSFKLKTTSNFTGQDRATFTVRSDAAIMSTLVTDTITQTYQFGYDPDAYIKSLTPAPTGLPTPTPTPPPNLQFEYIIIPEIRFNRAKVEIKTNIHTKTTMRFGPSPKNLSSSLFSNSPKIYHFFTLDTLAPDTEYYFQIEISDAYRSRASITSDIYTFKTAKISDVPQLNETSIIFTSSNTIFFDGFTSDTENLKNRTITLPTNTPFEFKFALEDKESVKSVLTVIRDSVLSQDQVLGISFSPKTTPNANFAQIVEVEKGVYVGRLLSLSSPGLTDVLVRVSDFEGNVIEYKIGTIKTVNPMRIVSKKTARGLENARVELSLYNPTQKMFQPISPEVIPIPNPAFSDPQGFLDLTLPHGKYRAEISLVRFEDETVEFTIGPYDTKGYPTVELESKPFAILDSLQYFVGILFDLREFTGIYTDALSSSNRMYDLMRLFALTALGLTVLIMLFKTIWTIFTHHLYPKYKRLINANSHLTQVKVLDTTTRHPVGHASIYLIDLARDKIISKAKTNRFGYATLHMQQPKSFRLSVLREGYETLGFYDFKKDTLTSITTLWMKKYSSKNTGTKRVLKYFIHTASVFVFELILCIIVALEFLFIRSYGINPMKPVLIITLITVLLLVIEGIISTKSSQRPSPV